VLWRLLGGRATAVRGDCELGTGLKAHADEVISHNSKYGMHPEELGAVVRRFILLNRFAYH
jgi:hypothetical protein